MLDPGDLHHHHSVAYHSVSAHIAPFAQCPVTAHLAWAEAMRTFGSRAGDSADSRVGGCALCTVAP
jgi:hypothetical protein